MSRDPARALTQFFGGRICLDFANTVDWRTSQDPQELLPGYEALLTWSRARRTMSRRAIQQLEARAARDHAAAAVALQQAHALRAQIWTLAEALRQHRRVKLTVVNRMLAAAPAQPQLIQDTDSVVHALPGEALEEPLLPVMWSLTALITGNDAARVGCCQAQGCGWFFVDESPNRTRMWCSSEVCGNRERARRAYAKRSGHA